MSSRNSFISLSEQIMNMQNNSLQVLAALSQVTSSNESQIQVDIVDTDGTKNTVSFPSVGSLKAELERVNQNIRTLSSLDQRGAIIQPSRNEYKKIIISDLNREPNPIGELGSITNFLTEKNNFLDAFLNPLLKVRLDLSGKVENNVRKIKSRRYLIHFEKDSIGNFTARGQSAIDSFNEIFKNRTNITITELESWLSNTPGIARNKQGEFIDYDEQDFELEPNTLQFDGFFTILGTDEDVTNKRTWYLLDTLDYYEVETKAKRTLARGDELIINTTFSTTRLRVIDINKDASEIRVRFETIEGLEPLPVGIVGGLKFYSPVINNKKVDISISFNEYNVLFIKAINTENHIEARTWSAGTAYYTNDLILVADNNNGDNGKSMTEYYIETVADFGEILKDLVNRQVPRHLAVTPIAPVLSSENFKVTQINKHLTDTPDLDKNRKRHQSVTELRSKLEELSKTITDKRRELNSKQFKNANDRKSLENQIASLVQDSESTSQLIKSTTDEIISNQQNAIAEPKFRVRGFWKIPSAVENGKTRPQEVIAFRVQYKYSSLAGQENVNEAFKVTDPDTGLIINAVFSPWTEYHTPTRDREFDVATQTFVWKLEDLQNGDSPNINAIDLPLSPNERIEIRVKAISEVGYPDSLVESEWSNTLAIGFPPELLAGRNPQELIIKNAELETLRSRIESDLNRKGFDQHLRDSIISESKYYAHTADNLGFRDGSRIISVSDKIIQIESADKVEALKELVLTEPWENYSNGYPAARYYKNDGRVYLTGLIRVILNDDDDVDYNDSYPNVRVAGFRGAANTNWQIIGRLPEGYRPSSRQLFPVITSAINTQPTDSSMGRLDITPNGDIILVEGNSGWVSLMNIQFRI